MKNHLSIGYVIALAGLVIVVSSLFPTFIPGSDSAFGPVQGGAVVAGLGIIVFGVDFVRQENTNLNLWAFIKKKYWIFLPWIGGGGIYAVIIVFSPRFSPITENQKILLGMAGLSIVVGIAGRLWQLLPYSRLINRLHFWIPDLMNYHWGIFIFLASIFSAFFFDIVRGSLLVFGVLFLIGFGPALFLFSPNRRIEMTTAFAPVIGFALITVVGSWFIIADMPVEMWASKFTVIMFAVSVTLILLWYKYYPKERKEINIRKLLHDIGLACGVVALVILPVALGGLKFSVFRGNQVDARNYMSMAAFLNSIPFSNRIHPQILLDSNPAYLWAVTFLHTRWATSMVMAYAVQISQIPLYRFDFAFTVLPFALVFAPLRAFLRTFPIGFWNVLLLPLCVATGYYAQVVQDSRAVSYATAIPVMIALAIVITRILDDDHLHTKNLPIRTGDAILLTVLVTALFLLYPEIFVLLITGIALTVLFYFLKGRLPLKKVIWMFVFGMLGMLIIAGTLPLYIEFFISQIKNSQQLFVNWHLAYFPWIYEDAPAGVWGLSPYQLAPLLSALAHGIGYILTCFLFIGLVPVLSVKNKSAVFFRLCAFISFGGLLIFSYAYYRDQFWQAGKFITFLYPFLILYMGILPSAFKEIHLPKAISYFPVFLQVVITTWLVSQAALAGYRFYVTSRGFEYPFHVQYTGNSISTYPAKYAWEIFPFVEQIQKTEDPVVWTSAENVFADNFWALILDKQARVLTVQPVIGHMNTIDLLFNSTMLPSPDYIIINNYTLSPHRWENPDWKLPPILYQDERYSLIYLGRHYPDNVILIGLASDSHSLEIPVNAEMIVSGNSGNTASLIFFSPKSCSILISAETFIYPENHKTANLLVTSLPSDTQYQFPVLNSQRMEVVVNIDKGYNFLPLKVTSMVLPEQEPVTIALTNLRFTEIACSD